MSQSVLRRYTNAIAARSSGATGAQSRAASLLAQAVREQANVLTYHDGFTIVSIAVIAMLMMTAMLRPAPVPQ